MLTISQAIGSPSEVGPKVIRSALQGAAVGVIAFIYWWGWSATGLFAAASFIAGAIAGSVLSVAMIVLKAWADVMILRREAALP